MIGESQESRPELDELLAGSDTPDVPPTEVGGEHRDVFISTPAPVGAGTGLRLRRPAESRARPARPRSADNEQIRALAAHPPADLAEYRLGG